MLLSLWFRKINLLISADFAADFQVCFFHDDLFVFHRALMSVLFLFGSLLRFSAISGPFHITLLFLLGLKLLMIRCKETKMQQHNIHLTRCVLG